MSGRALALLTALCVLAAASGCRREAPNPSRIDILTSDTLLAGMTAALLSPEEAHVSSILPPAQCPGHYDVKLSDIGRVRAAALVISMRGLPFMEKVEAERGKLLVMDDGGRSWMVPEEHIRGLGLLGGELAHRFPRERARIERRRLAYEGEVVAQSSVLRKELDRAGTAGIPVIASSMQAQTLRWMGFEVVAEYGRPEAISARDIVRLSRIAAERRIRMVVDNLQSGPDAGRLIAEGAGVPHVVLSNFPSEEGYLATLRANVSAVVAALGAGR